MVLCKFYALGKCKFGDRCWFEHVRDQGGRSYSKLFISISLTILEYQYEFDGVVQGQPNVVLVF